MTRPGHRSQSAQNRERHVVGTLTARFLNVPDRYWMLVSAALLVAFVAIRLVDLSADPPRALESGQGIHTDPASYTLYARNLAHFGDENPYHDDRFPLFRYSAVSLWAKVVFAFCDPSYASANFVGLTFSLGTALFVFLLVARVAGYSAGFFTLLLLILNQNQYQFGRLPFLENAMSFFGVVGLYCAVRWDGKRLGMFLAGALLALSVTMGKTHGLGFLAVIGIYALWQIYNCRERSAGSPYHSRRTLLVGYSWLALGCFISFALWYVFVGAPNASAIQAYLREQSTGLYGAPLGFESFKNFWVAFVAIGQAADLFNRMPGATVAFVAAIVWLTIRCISPRKQNSPPDARLNLLVLLILCGVIFHLMLAPWNYRPLRYMLVMVYPYCAVGGIVCAALVSSISTLRQNRIEAQKRLRVPVWGWIVLLIVAFLALQVPVFEAYLSWKVKLGATFLLAENRGLVLSTSAGLACAVVAGIWAFQWRGMRVAASYLAPFVALGLVGISLFVGWNGYSRWLSHRTYMTTAASQDLGKLLGQGAVISGSYGACLAQENHLGAVTHMFGVADPDSSFFRRFPVTHLLLDESNSERFKALHPSVAAGSIVIHKYHITNRAVELWRVAGATGNPQSDSYQLSPFEKIQLFLDGKLPDPSGSIFQQIVTMDTLNIALNAYMARRARRNKQFVDAEGLYRSVLATCPTDYYLVGEKGDMYREYYLETKERRYRDSAIAAFEEVLRYDPTMNSANRKLADVRGL